MPDAKQLADSYEYCRKVARTAARNFYYGFALLPSEKRNALCALYAFMRHADDISDSNAAHNKREQLSGWRAVMDRALQGEYGENRILPALHHTLNHFEIPASYLQDLMDGAEMDLTITRYPTFERLARYCYCVAGTVGLCCVHVFGFEDPQALELAPKLGIAFQLTNILRDVAEDYAMGRVYLPQEDLDRFGCTDRDLGSPVAGPAFIELMRFESNRAWRYYSEAAPLLQLISMDSQAALWTLSRIYSRILEKIETIGYDVLSKPHPSLSTAEKAWIMVRAGTGLWKPELCLRHM
jgi:15-cis-phytoene synthase